MTKQVPSHSHALRIRGMIIFLLALAHGFYLCCGAFGISATKESLMQDRGRSKLRDKKPIKTIKSEDGDIIDCIGIHKQPAFDHPALQNHTIQMQPSSSLRITVDEVEDSKSSPGYAEEPSAAATITSQTWHRSGACPEGTIPIRRDLPFATNSTRRYGRKYPSFKHLETKDDSLYLRQQNRSNAMLIAEGFAYVGGKGDIRVWNPPVEFDDDYSTSRIALKNGPYYDFESVEFGWAVNPSVYGDRNTRLYVYWTIDAYKETGCFDLTCPGFVQTNHEIALGASIYPISSPGGLPYQITLFVYKDPDTNNWWVQYGDKINIGYWPSNLFGRLNYHAESVEWGGEVFSANLEHPGHTATGMGSGQFADPFFWESGVINKLRILENSLVLKRPEWTYSYMDEWDCYRSIYVVDYVVEPVLTYGGPGRCPICL